ncbi:MAG: AIR carboxylase family protein [Candidatus Omnitrophica bacterium]|nr:AIR carboxylase family protein [Candidatus Omnitrophota bacterium]
MKAKIAIVLGSKSDKARLEEGFSLLKAVRIGYTLEIISAHRNPDELRTFCKYAKRRGIEVIIACAGLAAALPGFIASYVDIPVIGVPLEGGPLNGFESLVSIVEVPKGIGLVSTGIGKKGFFNAIIFALRILACQHKEYQKALVTVTNKFKK